MRPKKICCGVLIALLIVSIVGMVGCLEQEEEQVKVGALSPLTGSLATTGADVKNGALFAVDIINNEYDLAMPLASSKGLEGLKGAEVELVFGDTQGVPATGIEEATRLIKDEQVAALIGCSKSAVAAEVSKVAEDEGVPFLVTDATASSLTQQPHTWFFRTTPHDGMFVQNFFEFLLDLQEDKGIAVWKLGIVHEDSIWGSGTGESEVQYAHEYGYPVVERIAYSADATDLTREVQRLKEAQPDVVLQASYVNDAIRYMQTYKDLNFSPNAILANSGGFIDPTFIQVLGDDGDYILTREVWSKDLAATKPLVGTINQMYRERYGMDMNGNSARAFTGMLVLADAINRAGSTEPDAIRNALLETDISSAELIMPWDGVTFDPETHQNTRGKGIICQIINREYHTVWPLDLASKELIWPMPAWDERAEVT
jgi:branched-chain amino acid transport system substrate-binding protein